jgi:hypothetical protein
VPVGKLDDVVLFEAILGCKLDPEISLKKGCEFVLAC